MRDSGNFNGWIMDRRIDLVIGWYNSRLMDRHKCVNLV